MDSSNDVNAMNQEAQLTVHGDSMRGYACWAKLYRYAVDHGLKVTPT